MSKVMDGRRTHKYSTGDGNLAKIIIDRVIRTIMNDGIVASYKTKRRTIMCVYVD